MIMKVDGLSGERMRNWEVMSSSMVNWVSETEILIKDQIFKQGLFCMRVVFFISIL